MIFRFFTGNVIRGRDELQNNPEGGLTILELVTVLAIIAVLAAIGIPSFLNIKDRSTVGATEGNLAIIRKALNNYMVDSPSNHYPAGPLDYSGLRIQIPYANLPIFETDAKIQSGSFAYSSDGITFTFSANSTNRTNQSFTVTPQGIVKN
jgi:type II secretory pathway pseudopilin PulG